MKKLIYLFVGIIFFLTGCLNINSKVEIPNHTLYYVANDYVNNKSKVIKLDVKTGKKTELLDTALSVYMLRINDNHLYALFNNRIGYLENKKINYITNENEYINRYTINNNHIYYGKGNIYEKLVMIDKYGQNQKEINENNISRIIASDYLYYKPGSGADNDKLFRYNLDGTNKKLLINKLISQIIATKNYLYFINYNDNSSIYRIKKDGSNLKKIVNGPISFNNYQVNQTDGHTNMGVINDYLYYINSKEDDCLYKTNGKTNEKITKVGVSNLNVVDDYLYVTYKDNQKTGFYLLDKKGNELKRLTKTNYYEYVISKD